jgi:acetyltransferase
MGVAADIVIIVVAALIGALLAHLLMQPLISTASNHGLQLMEGDILASNHDMLTLAEKLGFVRGSSEESPDVEHVVLRM